MFRVRLKAQLYNDFGKEVILWVEMRALARAAVMLTAKFQTVTA